MDKYLPNFSLVFSLKNELAGHGQKANPFIISIMLKSN